MADAWKCWVDCIIRESPTMVKCSDNSGIYGLDGNPWSQSDNFNLTQKEVKEAIAVLDKGDGGTVIIGETKFFVLRIDGDHLVAKAQQRGITVAKGKTFVIIGQYEDDKKIMPGNNRQRVCTVKDQLCELGY